MHALLCLAYLFNALLHAEGASTRLPIVGKVSAWVTSRDPMGPAYAGDPLLAVYVITSGTNSPAALVKCDLSNLNCDAQLTLLASETGWAESGETDPGAAFVNRGAERQIAYISTTVPGNSGYLVFVSVAVDFAGGVSAPMTRLRSTTLSTGSGIAVCGAQHPTLPVGYFVTRNEDVWTITFPNSDGSIRFTQRE